MQYPCQRSNGSEPFPVFDQFHVAHGTHPFAYLGYILPQEKEKCKPFLSKIPKNFPKINRPRKQALPHSSSASVQ